MKGSGVVALVGTLLAACGGGAEASSAPERPAPPLARAGEREPSVRVAATRPPVSLEDAQEAEAEPEPTLPPPCPEDMVFVDAMHCPDARYAKVGLRCTKKERNKPNNLTICHAFEPGQSCPTTLRRQRFCMDRYEYPNVEGGHPPVQVSAFDGAAMCGERGKRLCWESEWVSACEGPAKLPFPYGQERSKKHCNIDNPWRKPSLKKAYSKNPAVQDRELRRLDQSIPSGSMESCKSGYGVYDLTGNFDEWVMIEYARGRSTWSGLKGGAWGHVRNACRPTTTSHVPSFRYYFISFRCCQDARPAASSPQGSQAPAWKAPPFVPPPPLGGKIKRGWTPTP